MSPLQWREEGTLRGTAITVTVLKIEGGAVTLTMAVAADAGAMVRWDSPPLPPGESFTVGPLTIEAPYILGNA